MVRHLQEVRTQHHFTFLVESTLPIDPLLKDADLLRHSSWPAGAKISQFLESQLSLPRTLRTGTYDVVHFLSQHDGALATPFPFILNILDTVQLSASHLYSFGQNLRHRVLRSILQRIIDKASAIITISEFSKLDMVRHYRLAPDKIHVTHLAAENRFFPSDSNKRRSSALASLKLPREFLLYVGGIDPRKNVLTLMRALALLYKKTPEAPSLVFAGRISNQPEYGTLMREVERLGLQRHVRFLGFVPDDLLPPLFSRAHMFVFPSLLEGFGLPVVQAMATGTPVVASATSSIPEVAGNAAFYADMTSPDDLAQVVGYVLTHPREAGQKIAEGKRRARRFSWKRTALSTVRVYEEVARARYSGSP